MYKTEYIVCVVFMETSERNSYRAKIVHK